MSPHDVEKLEEAKLKAKYPSGIGGASAARPIGGHSAFLQKRLAKGVRRVCSRFRPILNYDCRFCSKSSLIPVIIRWQNKKWER